MLRIRRAAFCNVGWKNAFFEGEVLDFTAPATGEPDDVVCQAVNGTGKSSALALLFSVFDTREDRFLRTLAKPAEKFGDYFGDEPALIAVEWDAPGRPRVTAQLVSRRSDRTLDRRWIAFYGDDEFGFSDLPFAGLGRDRATRLRSRDQLLRWIRDTEEARADSHKFANYDVQERWHERLEHEGIDRQLICWMVNLNKQEGGISKFLEFRNEDAFVDRLLEMVLSREQCDSARAQLADGIRHFAALASARDKLARVQSIEAKMTPLAESARVLLAADTEQREASAALAGLAAAIAEELSTSVAAARAATEETKDAAAALKRAETAQKEAAAKRNFTAAVLALSHGRVVEATARSAQAASAAATGRLKRLEAALDWREIAALDGRLGALRVQIDAATKDSEAPKAEAAAAGDVLRAALARAAKQARNMCSELEAAEKAARTAVAAAERAAKEADARISAASKTIGATQNTINRRTTERERLVETGKMGDTDTAATAERRWKDEAADARRRRESEIAAAEASERAASTHRIAAEAMLTEKAEALADEKRLAADLKQAAQDALAVRSDALLVQLCGDGANLESPSVQAILRDEEARCRREAVAARAEKETLEADKTAIETYGLAAGDPSSAKVVDHLRDNGVPDAMPFPAWRMRLGDGPDELRRLASDDPARFSGVAVPDIESATSKAAELASSAELPLDRPVAVYAGGSASTGMGAPRAVFVAARPEAYDGAAAKRLVGDFTRRVESLDAAADKATTREGDCRTILRRLADWLDKWGSGRMRAVEDSLKATRDRIAELETRITKSKTDEAAAATDAAARRKVAENLAVQAERADGNAREVQDYARLEAEADEANRALVTAEAERDEASQSKQSAEAEAVRQREAAHAAHMERKQFNLEADGYESESNTVKHFGGKPAADEVPLVTARARYEETSSAYDKIVKGKLADLEGLNANLRGERTRAEQEFVRRHGRPSAEITSLAAADGIEGELRLATEAEKTAAAQANAAATEAAEARGKAEATCRELNSGDRERAQKAAVGKSTEEGLLGVKSELAVAEAGAITAQSAVQVAAANFAAASQRQTALDRRAQFLHGLATAAPVGTEPEAVTKVALEQDEERLGEQVNRIRRRAEDATGAVSKAKKAAERDARELRRTAGQTVALLGVFASEIEARSEDELISSAENLLRGAKAVIESYRTDIEKQASEREFLIATLLNLARSGIEALRAIAKVNVPESIPRLGGQPIFKCRFLPSIGDAQRRDIVGRWLSDLVATQRIPASGHEIAAEIIRCFRLTTQREDLGIEILMPTDAGEIQYNPIARTKSSGGEGLTASLFLWCVLVRQRAKTQFDTKKTLGGALVLDNPLGTANHQLLLRSQRALARAMGIQLIFTTNINDYNAIGEFPNVLKFAKATTRGDRILVKVAHERIGEPPSRPGEAAA